MAAKIEKTDEEWRQELSPAAYDVLRRKGTEAAFTGEYDHVFDDGAYHCAGCGTELFRSDAKYDSGCGWPAFQAPAAATRSRRRPTRPTAWCAPRSCARLRRPPRPRLPGRPGPTGLRYCINSAAR